MESDILRQHSLALSAWLPKKLQTPQWITFVTKDLLNILWQNKANTIHDESTRIVYGIKN